MANTIITATTGHSRVGILMMHYRKMSIHRLILMNMTFVKRLEWVAA